MKRDAPARGPGTATSAFGAGRRESHDASAFYERFEAPELNDDDELAPAFTLEDPFVCGDARAMKELPDASVALVVTSPPYFAGKQYEQELGVDGVPASYIEYLELLHDVFAECKRVLEPGGRIAVNVANLGRKPYRSLSGDVTRILQDRLKLLIRGEVVWRKSEGASGNCAWGSFRSPANPSLRDVTERVLIASKGRFDRAQNVKARSQRGLPHRPTVSTDEFMAATLDVWDLPPESARRVHHPAPFPVELPQRLIGLYTWVDDLVLDPFMGSGSALVAAARLGRRYVGYDTDSEYVALARQRVAFEGAHRDLKEAAPVGFAEIGRQRALEDAGFRIVKRAFKPKRLGIVVPFLVADRRGTEICVELAGGFTVTATGLGRTATVWEVLGRTQLLAQHGFGPSLVLTSDLPRKSTPADQALRAAGPTVILALVDIRSRTAETQLRTLAHSES